MRRVVMTAIIMGLCAGRVYGVELTAGMRQMTVSGHLDQTEQVNFSIGGSVGYFVMDQVEAGIVADLAMLHGNDITSVAVGGFCEYNFISSNSDDFVPFVGGSLSLKYASYDIAGTVNLDVPSRADRSDTALEFCVYAGARYFMLDNFAVGSAARLFFATDEIYFGDNAEFESVDWDVILNTSFYF